MHALKNEQHIQKSTYIPSGTRFGLPTNGITTFLSALVLGTFVPSHEFVSKRYHVKSKQSVCWKELVVTKVPVRENVLSDSGRGRGRGQRMLVSAIRGTEFLPRVSLIFSMCPEDGEHGDQEGTN